VESKLKMGETGMVFGEGTFNTSAGEGSSTKRHRGRPVKVGHFHDDVGPTHFAKVVLSLGLEIPPIPTGFRPYLCSVPRMIILKMNNDCSWMVKLGTSKTPSAWIRVGLDLSFPMIGYFLTFKMLMGDVFKITIFDYTMTEVFQRCSQHHPTLAMIDE
jgi:hypothetical protein